MPIPPNASYNILAEEGLNLAPEHGFFQQMGQNIADSARCGALNQAGEIGATMGAGAVSLGSQALQGVGGAVRDRAVRAFHGELAPSCVQQTKWAT